MRLHVHVFQHVINAELNCESHFLQEEALSGKKLNLSQNDRHRHVLLKIKEPSVVMHLYLERVPEVSSYVIKGYLISLHLK